MKWFTTYTPFISCNLLTFHECKDDVDDLENPETLMKMAHSYTQDFIVSFFFHYKLLHFDLGQFRHLKAFIILEYSQIFYYYFKNLFLPAKPELNHPYNVILEFNHVYDKQETLAALCLTESLKLT